jgi:predicted metal-dependent hydrolase
VAAPLAVSDEAVRLAIISRFGWIKRQQAKFEAQPRQSKREMVSGESHYFWGHRYRLCVNEREGSAGVSVRNRSILDLNVPSGTSRDCREQVLYRWYREQLKAVVPALIEKWHTVLGVQKTEWGVKKMKTKWGTCNIEARRVWLNLELAKKSPECLEYIIVHELVHLLERHHNDRFTALMDKFMPGWRIRRDELNSAPLSHEDWDY